MAGLSGGQALNGTPDPALVAAFSGHKRLAQQFAELALSWLEHILRQPSSAAPVSGSASSNSSGEGSATTGTDAAEHGAEGRRMLAFQVCSESAVLEAAAGSPGGRQQLGRRLAVIASLVDQQERTARSTGLLFTFLKLGESAIKLGLDPMLSSRAFQARQLSRRGATQVPASDWLSLDALVVVGPLMQALAQQRGDTSSLPITFWGECFEALGKLVCRLWSAACCQGLLGVVSC